MTQTVRSEKELNWINLTSQCSHIRAPPVSRSNRTEKIVRMRYGSIAAAFGSVGGLRFRLEKWKGISFLSSVGRAKYRLQTPCMATTRSFIFSIRYRSNRLQPPNRRKIRYGSTAPVCQSNHTPPTVRFGHTLEVLSRFSLSEIKIYRRSWINRISKIYRKYRTKFKKKFKLFWKNSVEFDLKPFLSY